jgi:hypothetical protein
MMRLILALGVSIAYAQDLFLSKHAVAVPSIIATAGVTNVSSSDCGKAPESASTDTVSNQGKFSVWHAALGVLLWVDTPAYTQGAWVGSILYAFRPSDVSMTRILLAL